ncbi:ubiquitin-conjugating enzyme E2 1 [Cryptococcus deuterogattii CA1014]|nr:ubiquitin-conjugating enzyme E2 1 [Cryptococcus deuterogattii MMRL2647]KIR74667.1 ubiquitin-conjugating enzyme E2 1 [Cryptococcus deuterogattii CA1014]KIS01572.1 ubiquitin-conjugating enzyme E2 1 [Cryptococcus deuterogattii 2001/935-1]
MSATRLRRVQKEIKDCAKDKTSGITIEMIDDSPFHLVGAFPGPPDTPYEGGYYEVDIQIPETYPFQPVKMKFITCTIPTFHPLVELFALTFSKMPGHQMPEGKLLRTPSWRGWLRSMLFLSLIWVSRETRLFLL